MDAAVGNKAGSAALGTEGAVFAGAAIYAALTQLTLGFIMFCSVHTYTHIYKGYTNAASAASVPRFYWLFFAVGGASSVGFGLRGSLSARPLKPRRPGQHAAVPGAAPQQGRRPCPAQPPCACSGFTPGKRLR